jgi:hypothetical protein
MPELTDHFMMEGTYQPSKIWVYTDFLSETYKSFITNYIENRSQNRFKQNLDEKRSFSLNGVDVKLCGTAEYRAYQILWSLYHDKEYCYQTKDSIVNWSNSYLEKNLDPACKLLIQEARRVEPFNNDPNWIPVRGIINILREGDNLEAHLDADDQIIDMDISQVHSLTYYSNGGQGGDFWATDKNDDEFRYSPNPNDALIIQGSGIYHGVTRVKENTRLCMTIRFIHADDLILHGHPDKFLWKP